MAILASSWSASSCGKKTASLKHREPSGRFTQKHSRFWLTWVRHRSARAGGEASSWKQKGDDAGAFLQRNNRAHNNTNDLKARQKLTVFRKLQAMAFEIIFLAYATETGVLTPRKNKALLALVSRRLAPFSAASVCSVHLCDSQP